MKRTDSPIFTEDQKELIKKHLLVGAPEFEIERFFITCERTGLDCFSRQIYANLQNKNSGTRERPQWTKSIVIITSIDGFRAIAERSGEYRGQTPPEWYYTDAEGKAGWHDVFITARDRSGNPMTKPDACRVGVKRLGFDDPCYGVVSFDSFAKYSKGDGGYELDLFWKKMPEHMIAKVAEAQAHRKAFPLLACGLYVEEEVRADHEETAETVTVQKIEDKLLPGASYVETIQKAPPAAPVESPAPPAQVVDEKPVVIPPEKKIRAKKEAAPKEPAITIVSESGVTAQEIPLTKEPAAPAAKPAGNWEDYVICQITIPSIKGKKLSELGPKIASIYTGWVLKYATSIALDPAKSIEAEMITRAYNATKAA